MLCHSNPGDPDEVDAETISTHRNPVYKEAELSSLDSFKDGPRHLCWDTLYSILMMYWKNVRESSLFPFHSSAPNITLAALGLVVMIYPIYAKFVMMNWVVVQA